MSPTITADRRADLLDSLERPKCAKAKPDLKELEKAAQILKAAIDRSGYLQKQCGNHGEAQIARQIDGKEKLWFHEMVATWPPEVWRELLIVLAQTVCQGRFTVERTLVIREIA